MLVVVAIIGMAAKTDSCTWNISSQGDLARTQETDCALPDGGMYDCTGGPVASASTPDAGTTTTTGGGTTPAAVTVAIAPLNVTLGPNMTRQFTATVENAENVGVVWSIEGSPPTGVTIDETGLVKLTDQAASSGTFTIKAVSVADPTKSATSTVTLSTVSLLITPSAATLDTSGTQTFTATATPSGTAVAWSVVEGDGGVINPDSGLYTAPMTEGVYHVQLTSVDVPFLYAVATVTVISGPLPQVVISPTPSASVGAVTLTAISTGAVPGDTMPFTATVLNDTNTAVVWTKTDNGCNDLVLVDGAVTAGAATCSGTNDAVLTATSVDDPAASASVNISVVNLDSSLFTAYGTVTNHTTETGPVYVSVTGEYSGSAVVSAAAVSGGTGYYIIRAAPVIGSSDTTVHVYAWVDTGGVQTILPAVDPVYVSSSINTSAVKSTEQDVSLAFATVASPNAPNSVVAAPMDTGLMVNWAPDLASFTGWSSSPVFETAERYVIYAKAVPSGTATCTASNVGPTQSSNDATLTVPAGRGDLAMLGGLTNGNTYCLAIVAQVGSYTSGTTFSPTPFVAGEPSGTNLADADISVDYSSLASSLPQSGSPELYVGITSATGAPALNRVGVSSSGSSASVWINDLPDDTYQVFSLLDSNGNGYWDLGEPSFLTTYPPLVTVAGGNVTPPSVRVSMLSQDRMFAVSTSHFLDGAADAYSLSLVADSNLKPLAGARVDSLAAGATSPVDLAFNPSMMGPGSPEFQCQLSLGANALPTQSTFDFLLYGPAGSIDEEPFTQGTTVLLPTNLEVSASDEYATTSEWLSPVSLSTSTASTTCSNLGNLCSSTATLAPSFTGTSADSPTAASYCVKIIDQGDLGTATFQVAPFDGTACGTYNLTSVTTPSPAAPIALTTANITGLDSSLVNSWVSLNFGGSGFVAGDVYQFRVTPGVTVKATPTFTWTPPGNNNSTAFAYAVEMSDGQSSNNSGMSATTTFKVPSSWSVQPGDYTVSVKATDPQGNQATSAGLRVSVPTMVP